MLSIEKFPDAEASIWWVDAWGNCKTTMLPEDVKFEVGSTISTNVGELTCYERLKDVPANETAIIIGSSGLGSKRFLEIVVQGNSAADKFNLKSGSELSIKNGLYIYEKSSAEQISVK